MCKKKILIVLDNVFLYCRIPFDLRLDCWIGRNMSSFQLDTANDTMLPLSGSFQINRLSVSVQHAAFRMYCAKIINTTLQISHSVYCK